MYPVIIAPIIQDNSVVRSDAFWRGEKSFQLFLFNFSTSRNVDTEANYE